MTGEYSETAEFSPENLFDVEVVLLSLLSLPKRRAFCDGSTTSPTIDALTFCGEFGDAGDLDWGGEGLRSTIQDPRVPAPVH